MVFLLCDGGYVVVSSMVGSCGIGSGVVGLGIDKNDDSCGFMWGCMVE